MGSGETSPTMVKTHRQLLARLGQPPVPAVLLDTPFGFQENASELSRRAVEYFAESVGAPIEVASYRSAACAEDTLAHEAMLARLRQARYVFAGPGSPSYALRQWNGSQVPKLVAEKLVRGGTVTFASAAALTLGVATVPVYEIYKVGEDPHWLEGLNLMDAAGLRAAVIPHFNNNEGRNHDTRFCYLGERRLAAMEEELAEGDFVLGVDEHTGCILDLEAAEATVVGLGVVTVRRRGASAEIPAGTTVGIARLAEMASELGRGGPAGSRSPLRPTEGQQTGQVARPAAAPALSPLMAAVRSREAAFDAALASRDAAAAVRAVLELDDELRSWSADTLQSDELDQGRSALRSMVVRLGEMAERGTGDPAEEVAPFVDTLLERREVARAERRFAEADAVRDRLVDLGVEVRDTPGGAEWSLRPSGRRG